MLVDRSPRQQTKQPAVIYPPSTLNIGSIGIAYYVKAKYSLDKCCYQNVSGYVRSFLRTT
jgi:hypothetical protein